jgi:MFS family permease
MPESPALLSQPNLRRFFTMRVAATAANQMLMVALGWQMYALTGSAWDLGLVGLAQFVPALLMALPAGHTVDRRDRRRLLTAVLGVQAAVALALAVGSQLGWVGRASVLAVSVVLGAVRSVQMPASSALLPQLLASMAQLPRVLALSSSATQAAIVVGPALGGVLYAAGAPVVYGLAALCLGVAMAAVHGTTPRPAERSREPASWATLLAGLHFIRARPVLLGAVTLDLFAVLLGGATALLPIFAKDILHTGAWGLGVLRAAPAAGALLTAVVLSRWPVQRRTGTWLLGAVGVYGLMMLAFGLSTTLWAALAALLVAGVADMVSVVIRQTLVQLETPDAMRGRVSAVNGVFIGASNQLGEFESGATAAWLGPVGSVLLGGAGTVLVVVLWTGLFPALARRDRLLPPAASRSHVVTP